jgi:AraC family transcriptional regulator
MLTTTTPTIEFKHKGLTHTQLQQVLDYIQTHLDSAEPTLGERDLSLAELAETLNLSPTYFATAFKQALKVSPHQYVIQQRVERAKLMLSKTDLAIRATHRLSQRRHCFTSWFLQSKPFKPTV